ncbi:Uncharacterised protein [Acinetobacter baumannii]|nr:Uncharacterised protein [Acinetobacter baumannii]
MSAHLSTINGVFRTHAFFNESMAGFRHHRYAPGIGDHIDGVPTQAWIVDDLRARLFLQEGLRQQADDIIALNEIAFFIEQEAAIEIAVERNAHISAMLTHRIGGIRTTLRQQWVGNTVRERAVRLVMHLDKLQRHTPRLQLRLNSIDHMPCRTVARVDH